MIYIVHEPKQFSSLPVCYAPVLFQLLYVPGSPVQYWLEVMGVDILILFLTLECVLAHN